MGEIIIAYWSGSGNTEAMASMVAKGVEAAGKAAKVVSIDDFQASELKDETVFALGCPAMGDEVLEETIVGAVCGGGREICIRQKDRSVRLLRLG